MPKPGPSGSKMGRSYAQPKSFQGGQSKRLKTNDLEHGSAYDPSKYCTLHGKYGHDLSTCKVMLDQGQKMRANWQSGKSGGGQNDRLYAKKQADKELQAF